MSWIGLRGSYPICDGSRKDCRQNDETNLVHCREANANPIDWVFRGTDSLGFGLWAQQSDCEEWASDRRREWREERERQLASLQLKKWSTKGATRARKATIKPIAIRYRTRH